MDQSRRDPSIRTFRGPTLESVLPRIREELGEDAIVMARREGLSGGVGGFFQRPFVEVEARPGLSAVVDEDGGVPITPALARNDAATAEGLSTPGVQELLRQAAPFARELERASGQLPPDPDLGDRTPTLAEILGSPPPVTGGYGRTARVEDAAGQPPAAEPDVWDGGAEFAAPEPPAPPPTPPAAPRPAEAGVPPVPPAAPRRAEADVPPVPPAGASAVPPVPPPAVPEPPRAPAADTAPRPRPETTAPQHPPLHAVPPAAVPPEDDEDADAADDAAGSDHAARGSRRPGTADAIERRLVAAGLSPALAAELVGEAVVHLLPFSAPRNLRKLVRSALARRIRVLESMGPAPRSLALVGAGGSGKTTLAAHLASAYARNTDLGALVVALRPADDGATLRRLLDGTGAEVAVVATASDARKRAAAVPGRMVLLDAPAVAPRDEAGIKALAQELHEAGVEEVHFCLPAATSAPAARELSTKLKPLQATAVAITQADATESFGAVVELCLATGRPVSYLGEHEAVGPADPADLAARLLP